LHFLRRVIGRLIKEIPTRYRHDQTAPDLHNEQRNAEEGEISLPKRMKQSAGQIHKRYLVRKTFCADCG